MAAAFALAQEMNEDEIIVVQETEYTGAGKLPPAQLTFAKEMGIEVRRGDPREEKPGESIVIPEHPKQIEVKDMNLHDLRKSYIKNCMAQAGGKTVSEQDLRFLAEDTKIRQKDVVIIIEELGEEG